MTNQTPRTTAAAPADATVPVACMTLREYFASQALIGILQSRDYSDFSVPTQARMAFDLADALLLHSQRSEGA
jgi:hypothetical protein